MNQTIHLTYSKQLNMYFNKHKGFLIWFRYVSQCCQIRLRMCFLGSWWMKVISLVGMCTNVLVRSWICWLGWPWRMGRWVADWQAQVGVAVLSVWSRMVKFISLSRTWNNLTTQSSHSNQEPRNKAFKMWFSKVSLVRVHASFCFNDLWIYFIY